MSKNILLKYSQLPLEINSPLTNNQLSLQDKKTPIDKPLTIVNIYENNVEVFDPCVAMYYNEETKEAIYIPFDED